METKYKVLVVVVGLGAAFAAGRYTTPEKIRVETKIVEVVKESKDVKKDVKKVVKKKTITKPDGTKETTTETTTDSSLDKKTEKDTSKNSDTSSETARGDSKVTINALVGLDFNRTTPVYGLSCTKPILGPLTVGLWGLTNATAGASIGLSF